VGECWPSRQRGDCTKKGDGAKGLFWVKENNPAAFWGYVKKSKETSWSLERDTENREYKNVKPTQALFRGESRDEREGSRLNKKGGGRWSKIPSNGRGERTEHYRRKGEDSRQPLKKVLGDPSPDPSLRWLAKKSASLKARCGGGPSGRPRRKRCSERKSCGRITRERKRGVTKPRRKTGEKGNNVLGLSRSFGKRCLQMTEDQGKIEGG